MSIATLDPSKNLLVKSYEEYSSKKIDRVINAVDKKNSLWSDLPINERAKFICDVSKELKRKANDLAELITLEMGKPIKESRAEIEKCALVCDYYVKHAKDILSNENYLSDAKQSFVQFIPLGTILAVMPWNFPFWQVFRFAAPTLIAGNTILLKHASNVPQCALAIEKIFIDAGLPKNIFRTLLMSAKSAEKLLDDDRIKAVTLTGSEKAGSKIGAKAGENIKKSVMELGGSDAFIVTEHADIEQAVDNAIKSRFQNTGQSCIAAKRFILINKIADDFLGLFIERVKLLKAVDPMWDNADLGPIARKDLRDTIHRQVKKSVSKGAKIMLGGKKIKSAGFYYPATVLTEVSSGMPAYDEELFGPVASIIRVRNMDKAIMTANDTQYGLGSSIWCRDEALALKYAQKIQAGATFINDMVKSDPKLPFGGIKRSGYGRELSDIGIKEFVNIKTIYMN